MSAANDPAELFRHVSAEKAALYRCTMDVVAAAKRQYRLQLRPDEIWAEARRPDGQPRIEEVNAALAVFARTSLHRAELQTLPDSASPSTPPDLAKAHEALRDPVRVFEGLAKMAQAFMAGMARSIELHQADATAVVSYKRRPIDCLDTCTLLPHTNFQNR